MTMIMTMNVITPAMTDLLDEDDSGGVDRGDVEGSTSELLAPSVIVTVTPRVVVVVIVVVVATILVAGSFISLWAVS